MHNSHNVVSNLMPITGALLAGGRSRRMGRDKALLVHAGLPLWERCRQALQTVCSPVLIAGDRPDLAGPELPCFPDAFPGSSLAGLHTALAHSTTDWALVMPCDLPYPSPQLLETLRDACDDTVRAVVPRTPQGREPLIAAWHRDCLPAITWRLSSNRPKLLELLDEIEVRYLDSSDLPPGWRRALRNLNTPDDLARLQQDPPVISFIAASGTGKTTLLEKLIAALADRGWRIGVLKHDAHDFDIDHEGKDSWRLTRAGAAVTGISSPHRSALIRQHELAPNLDTLLEPYTGEVDVVLTEGFSQSALPKIEIHRKECDRPLLSRGGITDPTLIAVASDVRPVVDVPVFDLNDITPLAAFIEERFLA